MTDTKTRLVAGEITAWRAWTTVPRSRDPFGDLFASMWWSPHRQHQPKALYAIGARRIWPASRPSTAVCLVDVDHGELEAPGESCTCGNYAVADRDRFLAEYTRDLDDYADYLHDARTVLGSVRLWGRTIVHAHGYRSQYARGDTLLRLWDTAADEAMHDLAAAYGMTIVDWPIGRTAVKASMDRRRDAERRRAEAERSITMSISLDASDFRRALEGLTGSILGAPSAVPDDTAPTRSQGKNDPDRPVPKPAPYYRGFEQRNRHRIGRG